MKMQKLMLGMAILSLIVFVFIYFVGCSFGANTGRKETFKELLGSYVLDLDQTKLGADYIKDSVTYKKLVITFFPDSTFRMNMRVPFMYDSIGRWRAGNVNEWCWLLFDSFKYDDKNENSGSQFTRPYKEKSDTFFLINAATPRDNNKTVSDIYFKKIKIQ
ncbi:MAG TPA: hypothetical protein VMT76_00710 [Puia sp.]|nr:hypothetical protein [Puia sp.]